MFLLYLKFVKMKRFSYEFIIKYLSSIQTFEKIIDKASRKKCPYSESLWCTFSVFSQNVGKYGPE